MIRTDLTGSDSSGATSSTNRAGVAAAALLTAV